MPLFCVFLGALVLAAGAVGGELWFGLFGFGLMAALGLIFLIGRSETLRGLGGPERDERWHRIDVTATAFAGGVVIVGVIGAWLYELADGQDGSPYTQLAALGGLAYVLAVVVLRRRG